MGFIDNVAGRIRSALKRDKNRVAIKMATGTNPTAGGGFDLLNTYGHSALAEYLKLDQDILARYGDYAEMDDYPLISSAIDIFADDASQPDVRRQRTVWINSENERITEIGDRLFHRTLRMDEEIWDIARQLVKMGNDFEEILVTEDGVRGLNFLPAEMMRRVEGVRGELFGYVQTLDGKIGYTEEEHKKLLDRRFSEHFGGQEQESEIGFEHWEIAHFRLRSKQRRSVYGHSVLEPARWIWRRLILLEDSALIYRLQRAPERFAFYVDVGDLPPAEALAWLNRVRQMHRKKKFVNPQTGKLDLKYETLAQDDDFYVPVRKGVEGTRIETLGAPQWQHMDDVNYFRDQLFAAIKIPRAYLGLDEGVVRAVLSSQDVRFARTVLRVQRELRNGLAKIMRVHLAALNVDPFAYDFDVEMTVPSSIFELAQMEAQNARADLASRMREFVSLHWVLSRIFNFSDDEIEQLIKEREDDTMREAEQAANAQAKTQEILAAAMNAMGQGQQPGMPPQPGMDPTAMGGAPPAQMGAPGAVPPQMAGAAERAAMRIRHDQRILMAGRDFHSGNLITAAKGGISERELFAGSREAEKRADDKLEKVLKNDAILTNRLQEVGELLRDLKASMPRRR